DPSNKDYIVRLKSALSCYRPKLFVDFRPSVSCNDQPAIAPRLLRNIRERLDQPSVVFPLIEAARVQHKIAGNLIFADEESTASRGTRQHTKFRVDTPANIDDGALESVDELRRLICRMLRDR